MDNQLLKTTMQVKVNENYLSLRKDRLLEYVCTIIITLGLLKNKNYPSTRTFEFC